MTSIRQWMTGFGLLTLAACSHDRGIAGPCGDGALGTSRIQTVSLDTGYVPDLLAPGEVILTFDDGPHPSRTRRVLDLLDRDCVQATFFLIGTEARDQPDRVREIVARGHTLGGHSWDHPYLSKVAVGEAVENIRSGMQAIEAATGTPVLMFRFPFIDTTPELSEAVWQAGYLDVTVTVDGADWLDQTPEESVGRVMAGLEARGRRGIILLHDPYRGSDRRTRLLLEALKAENYKVVALKPAE
ncbi:MAG: polysaccharide deacetylase family protein [Hyphomonas sp.]